MKRHAVWLSLALLALAPAARAAEDPFAEFRIPDHAWQSGSADVRLSGQRHDQSGASQQGRNQLGTGNLITGIARGWDSDAFQSSVRLHLIGDASRQSIHNTYPAGFGPSSIDAVSRQSDGSFALDAGLLAYPWDPPVGFGLSGSAEAGYDQSWSRMDAVSSALGPPPTRTEQRLTQSSHGDRSRVSLSATVGLGRVRDATVVYDVHVLEMRLRRSGALARPLSPEAREKLAALFFVAPDFAAPHERPDRFVWREVERILREDGALAERALDAYDVLLAREPVQPARGFQRRRGVFLGALARGMTEHDIRRDDADLASRAFQADTLVGLAEVLTSQRTVRNSNELWVGGRAEYHRPLGWNWQLDAFTQTTGPARSGERGLDFSTSAELGWLVADRWAADFKASHERAYEYLPGFSGPWEDGWTVIASAGLGYYLEDHLVLSLSAAESQRRGRAGAESVFARDAYGYLTLTWRFLGRLDAPEIMEPMRPL